MLDPSDPLRSRTGALVWRGGLEVTHPDGRFGGISGLHISADGSKITAITDRGSWITARLSYRHEWLAGMTEIQIGNLKGYRSDRLDGSWRDAEALAVDDADILVAFERHHRIWRYPAGNKQPALAQRPVHLETPAAVAAQPYNSGVEALTKICNGQLLAISEDSRSGPGSINAWLRTANGWFPLTYAVSDGHRPTGAATLPDCDVVVVERHFNILTGVRVRIVRISAHSIKPGATLRGRTLGVLAPPMTVDNIEGIAARRGDKGETLLYLVSDDNFSALQRTLLLLFELAPDAG